MAKKNYYKILGVSRTASPEEISAAKNRLAKKYHPDANMKDGIDTTKKMQRIGSLPHTFRPKEACFLMTAKDSESHRQTAPEIPSVHSGIII